MPAGAGGASPTIRRGTGAAGGGAGAAEVTGAGRAGGAGGPLAARPITRAGSGGSSASSRSHAALLGAILSSAQASRWRSVATWLSQHGTEQNTSRIRARLQVETLHWKYFAPNAMSLRQALHTSQVSAMPAG